VPADQIAHLVHRLRFYDTRDGDRVQLADVVHDHGGAHRERPRELEENQRDLATRAHARLNSISAFRVGSPAWSLDPPERARPRSRRYSSSPCTDRKFRICRWFSSHERPTPALNTSCANATIAAMSALLTS